jgi:hypothetical protein
MAGPSLPGDPGGRLHILGAAIVTTSEEVESGKGGSA